MSISKKIKEIREDKGLKQYEIAEKLGVERTFYTRLEKRGDKLSIEQLKQIAGALGVTIKDILFDEESTPNERELEFAEREIALLKREVALLKKINSQQSTI